MEEKWGKDIKAEDLQKIIQRRNIYEGYLDTMYNSMSYSRTTILKLLLVIIILFFMALMKKSF